MLILLNFSFRDGVSEGQFYQVLLYELDAIRKVGQTSYFPFVNLLTTFVELTNMCFIVGMCIPGTKLPASCNICGGSKASSYKTICK
jgi:hypothetical protein